VLPQRARLTPRGGVLGPNVGTQRSPNCSPCKRNMSLGSRQCPNRYARAPPVRHCRRSLISISTNCSPSSHPVASGEIENGLSARTASARACPGGCTGTSHAPLRQTCKGRVAGARIPPMHYLPPAQFRRTDVIADCQTNRHLEGSHKSGRDGEVKPAAAFGSARSEGNGRRLTLLNASNSSIGLRELHARAMELWRTRLF